jgi:hypothetical protein
VESENWRPSASPALALSESSEQINPRCRQMDRVRGPQQAVGFDDGGADNALVDLGILEGVKQPLRIRDQRGPFPRHSTTDLDPQQVRADPAVTAVLAIEGEECLSMLLGGQELRRGAGVQVIEGHLNCGLAVRGLESFACFEMICRNKFVQIRSVDWTNGFWVINLRALRDGGDYGRVP